MNKQLIITALAAMMLATACSDDETSVLDAQEQPQTEASADDTDDARYEDDVFDNEDGAEPNRAPSANTHDMVGRYFKKEIDMIFYEKSGNVHRKSNFYYDVATDKGQKDTKLYKVNGTYRVLKHMVHMLCYDVDESTHTAYYAFIPPVAQWNGDAMLYDSNDYALVGQLQPWIFYSEETKDKKDLVVEDRCADVLPSVSQVKHFIDAMTSELGSQICDKNDEIYFTPDDEDEFQFEYYRCGSSSRIYTSLKKDNISIRYYRSRQARVLADLRDDDVKGVLKGQDALRILTQAFAYFNADWKTPFYSDDISYWVLPTTLRWGVHFYGERKDLEEYDYILTPNASKYRDYNEEINNRMKIYLDEGQYDPEYYNWTKVNNYALSFATSEFYGRDGKTDELIDFNVHETADDWVVVDGFYPCMSFYGPGTDQQMKLKGRNMKDHAQYPLRVVYLLDEKIQ